MSEEVLRRRLARQQEQLEQLETMIEDRARDIFHVNEELQRSNAQLAASLAEQTSMQRALVDASRTAGMAEVATNVLHNVGNVLNSVNVSASVITGMVRASKASGLRRALALLTAQPDRRAFLVDDPRGEKWLAYVEAAVAAVQTEQERILEELADLERNVDHIKAIVTTQQTHARRRGACELFTIAELVDDGIRLLATTMDLGTVELVEEYALAGELRADRHAVFQILMNLLTNAVQAVGHRPEGRRIVVRVRLEGPRHVAVEVEDNGMGIARDNLTKIFGHGFTTKADGHGFGLHSSACAAGELGGRIEVHSDGVGRGAVFRLVLPLQPTTPSGMRPPVRISAIPQAM